MLDDFYFILLLFLWPLSLFFSAGSIGDLNGCEDPSDDVSMSGEEGGASDQEDSAECDGSSPPSFTPLYNEGEMTHTKMADLWKSSEAAWMFSTLCLLSDITCIVLWWNSFNTDVYW